MTDVAARGEDPSHLHPDRLIALVAARQDGIVLREQLAALGLKRGAIAHRRHRGLLVRLHDGVYLWGQPEPTTRARGRAAAAASGRGAWVSHAWGLAMWDLRAADDSPVDVSVVGRRVRAPAIRGHESGPVRAGDVRLLDGIPVSSPARALLEAAAELSPRDLAAAVERAQIKRLVTARDIARAIERAPRRAGVSAMRALLDEAGFTRSVAERRLKAVLRAARLPPPVFNGRAEGYEVDVLWRRERVVMEFDSYTFHATRAALIRDRERTAALQRARYVVLRTTWVELTRQSHALIARTAEALALSERATTAPPARAGP